MKATERMINSVWTLEYEIESENTLKILAYSRDDKEGYEKEKELPRCNLTESSGRRVVAVTISPNDGLMYGASMTVPGSKFYTVSNPRNIFRYDNE